jgi:hypothetical protein
MRPAFMLHMQDRFKRIAERQQRSCGIQPERDVQITSPSRIASWIPWMSCIPRDTFAQFW